MIDISSSDNGHSAMVQMRLHTCGRALTVVQASRGAVKLLDATAVPYGNAELEIIVDGASRREPVQVVSTESHSRWVGIE